MFVAHTLFFKLLEYNREVYIKNYGGFVYFIVIYIVTVCYSFILVRLCQSNKLVSKLLFFK